MNTPETQKVFKWAGIVLIILALFLAVQTVAALKGLKSIDPAYNSISVTGESRVEAKPDIASFSFTVSADAKEVSQAQASVTTKTDAVLAALKELGIEERDIKTSDYNIYPKYTYERMICAAGMYCPPGREVPDGYTASHSITVKVRKIDDAGKALAAAGSNGATGLSSISLTIDDRDALVERARVEAIEDAREKAEALADSLDVKLVRVVNFYDNTSPIPYYAEAGYGGDAEFKSANMTAPTIPVGENTQSVSVTVIYEIR